MLKLKNFNTNTDEYLNFIFNLEVKTITCPWCDTTNIERHGYYFRYINIFVTKY